MLLFLPPVILSGKLKVANVSVVLAVRMAVIASIKNQQNKKIADSVKIIWEAA